MNTIWKYTLIPGFGAQAVKMPEDAIILSAGTNPQDPDQICVWAEVCADAPLVIRTIEVFPTGGDMPCDMGVERRFIDTVRMPGLAFHVYERIS